VDADLSASIPDAVCTVDERALRARFFKQEMIYAALKAPLFHGNRCFR
jgi:hypothetical protein